MILHRSRERIYWARVNGRDAGLIFGAPGRSSVWCSVYWLPTNGSRITEFHVSLAAARLWMLEQIEKHRSESLPEDRIKREA